jgi:hypothetical protein
MLSQLATILCFLLVDLMILSVTHFVQSGDWMITNNDLERTIGLTEAIVA